MTFKKIQKHKQKGANQYVTEQPIDQQKKK